LSRRVTIKDEAFEALLAWLDPDDREAAGQKYEIIYAGLVRVFVSRGFSDAEDLADETIDRVMSRLPDIRDTYEGPRVKYFYGVARNIVRERIRPPREIATDVFPVSLQRTTFPSDEYVCLLKCLELLPPNKRELILDYHVYQGPSKIEEHRNMADELAISENALRVRACHIRAKLEKCVIQCTQDIGGKQNIAASA
jgi:DNA-directed RNA polymerase specialized sigma24 family protein